MTEYVSQGDGFLMNDNDPTRPMVMYYHNLIMQYAEQGDVQSVRHNLRLVKGSSGALARALHRAALGDGRVLKVLLEAAGTAATAELNTRSEYGWTALSRAACQGKSECVALLLAAGADPDRRIVDHVYNHTQGRGVVPRVVPRGYYGQLRALWYYAGCTVGRGSPRS